MFVQKLHKYLCRNNTYFAYYQHNQQMPFVLIIRIIFASTSHIKFLFKHAS